jgi:hypothetical protein
MESPVTGGITPLSLGELRQAILAVYIGNPLFSAAEQLEANHDAHACEDLPYLEAWLRGVRLEDAKRGLLRRNQVARTLDYPGVRLDKDQHLLEMEALLRCRAFRPYQQQAAWGVAYPGLGDGDRLQALGFCYQLLLENLGRVPARRGFQALGDN